MSQSGATKFRQSWSRRATVRKKGGIHAPFLPNQSNALVARLSTEPDAEPVTLPIRCQKCGQAVTLTYRPTKTYPTDAWFCPYRACRKLQNIALSGSIVRLVASYEPRQ